jgi:sugar-specific transcriptional regulator TrmB
VDKIHHEDFEEVLSLIKRKLGDTLQFEEIRSIESNFDTKGMMFKSKRNEFTDGTIIAGEDNGLIAVDISKPDGEVINFILKDIEDEECINNILKWFQEKYK